MSLSLESLLLRHRIALTSLVAFGSIAVPAVQERVKKKEAKDFPALLAEAAKTWENGSFGACMQSLDSAKGLVAKKRREAVLDAFPAPTLNATYADRHGHIGFRTGGVIPQRGAGQGLVPQDGSDPEAVWQGLVAPADMPEKLDPAAGFRP